jgi:hypothetical protein
VPAIFTMNKTHKVTVCMSRTSNDVMLIHVRDESSSTEFVRIEMTKEQFVNALTSSIGEGEAEYRGLDHLGKKRVSEERTAECPLSIFDRKQLETWLYDNKQESGWILDCSLRSQSSIVYNSDKGCKLNYRVHKYV